MGPAAFIGTFNVATGWVYLATGTTRRQFFWVILATSVTVTAYIIGLRWGPVGVAAAYSIATIVLRYPSVMYCFHGSHLRVRDLDSALWRPAAASVTAGIILYAAGMLVTVPGPVVASLGVDLAVYMISYIVVWLLLPRGRRSAAEILQIVKDLRPAPPGTEDKHDGQEKTN
jgi:hypothetical protein